MISDFIEFFIDNLNVLDVIFSLIMIYSIIQCFLKGFTLSFISFMKWILSLIITIILVPKLQPIVSNYIESEFVNQIGLGILIFVISIFIMTLAGKAIGRALTWTGAGNADKSFGLLFGFFKGYVVSVCLFTIFNWFYPYQNWGISAEAGKSFNILKKSSVILVEEFPNVENINDTKEKIEEL